MLLTQQQRLKLHRPGFVCLVGQLVSRLVIEGKLNRAFVTLHNAYITHNATKIPCENNLSDYIHTLCYSFHICICTPKDL